MIYTRILIGLIAILVTIATIVFIGINEPDRQDEFKGAFLGRSIEVGAGVFEQYCSPCHGLKGQGSPRAPQINSKEFFENRLRDLGYAGTMEAYLTLTIRGGRPVKSDPKWPQNMPTWSVDFGGPLRNDQIGNVVDFIMSWEKDAPSVGTEPAAITAVGDTPEERGRSLVEVGAGCIACHTIGGTGGSVGPNLTNVYAEKGPDYIRESILMPSAVIAEGFSDGIMPQTFGQTLTEENINDIIAYLKSVSGQ